MTQEEVAVAVRAFLLGALSASLITASARGPIKFKVVNVEPEKGTFLVEWQRDHRMLVSVTEAP